MVVSQMLRESGSPDRVPDAIRRLSSVAVPELLGGDVRARSISYQNPIEIIIGGAAFTMWGTVQVLRLIRDWSARRRAAEAAADIAEAEARQAKTRADVIDHLGREVIGGRLHLPPSQLAALVSSGDLAALQSLIGPEATLELPSGVVASFDEP